MCPKPATFATGEPSSSLQVLLGLHKLVAAPAGHPKQELLDSLKVKSSIDRKAPIRSGMCCPKQLIEDESL